MPSPIQAIPPQEQNRTALTLRQQQWEDGQKGLDGCNRTHP
jgi:hypothetical protein